ncbi:MAG: hypothetical protein Q9204_004749 [Flavoplaca sp. TL-2023a]
MKTTASEHDSFGSTMSPSAAEMSSAKPAEPTKSEPSTFESLKVRIRHHYELASEYYYSLWGEHIHHGYFLHPNDTKDVAQIQLIELLLQRSNLAKGSKILDVGCGIGGITISGKQVEMATKLTKDASGQNKVAVGEPIALGNGSVRFLELDAETMGEHFAGQSFDCVWISEAMSHLPDKELFFRNAFELLKPRGKLVIADWFKAEDLTEKQVEDDIKPIEDGMLLPPLCTQSQYVKFGKEAGFGVFSDPFDISQQVLKTW